MPTFRDILNLALRFQKIVGEDVTSRESSLMVISEEETRFDTARMEDDGSLIDTSFSALSISSPSAKAVLCTTQAGLRVLSYRKDKDGMEQRIKTILLKPKVTLYDSEQHRAK